MSWKSMGALACVAVAACHSQDHSGTVPALPERLTVAPPFSVTVELTSEAAAELRQRKETIIVNADFYGLANTRGRKYGDHMGQIYWSEPDEVERDGPGVAQFRSRNLNLALLDYLEDGKPEVLINVVSGRRTSKNNLLDCDIFEDSVYVAAKDGIRIACDLIYPK